MHTGITRTTHTFFGKRPYTSYPTELLHTLKTAGVVVVAESANPTCNITAHKMYLEVLLNKYTLSSILCLMFVATSMNKVLFISKYKYNSAMREQNRHGPLRHIDMAVHDDDSILPLMFFSSHAPL